MKLSALTVMRSVMQSGNMRIESIIVGNESRYRAEGVPGVPPEWQCPRPQPGANAPAAPQEQDWEYEVSRMGEATVEGVKAYAYMVAQTLHWNEQTLTNRYRLYVSVYLSEPNGSTRAS